MRTPGYVELPQDESTEEIRQPEMTQTQPEPQVEAPGLGGLVTGALPGIAAAILALFLIAGIVVIARKRK
jgi:hypothetical protein